LNYYALFSGGIDSTLAIISVIAHKKAVTLIPLFFKYGQRAEFEEQKSVRELVEIFKRIKGNDSTEIKRCEEYEIGNLFKWSKSCLLKHNPANTKTYDVENRNMVLISCAASIIMANYGNKNIRNCRLIVGFKNEHYDTKKRFANAMNEVFHSMNKSIIIETPLINNDSQVRTSAHYLAKLAHKFKVLDIIEKDTWSCYFPDKNGTECGDCPACLNRGRFLKELKIRSEKKQA
jgi:7-cyano-7-deazaguanine synthase in queuosine biosynthesis